ncbi:MAG: DUF4347 domain-containing protein, partial [Gammaproteobacteria bacterium]|nr:DUF4347 domain-containing protein [Gammaproteobacteria bacterium]
AAVATGVEALAGAAEHAAPVPDERAELTDLAQALAMHAVPGEPKAGRQEIVFVDTAVADFQRLVGELPDTVEVVLIAQGQNGFQVIADTLAGRSGVDAVHILSHGDTGRIQLGGEWMDAQSLSTQAESLSRIGTALSEHADILLYGCETGADQAGEHFIRTLSDLTGADVTASSDKTGASSLGGNWVLEASTGSIESEAFGLGGFDRLLALPPDGSYSFEGATLNVDGTYTTADGYFVISALDGNGGDSPLYVDELGAFISELDNNTSGTSYIEVSVASGGSFNLNSAVVGDAGLVSANTDFFDVYVEGYAGGLKVAETPKHSSIGVLEADYGLDFSDFSGKLIDQMRVYYSWSVGDTFQGVFNLGSLNIANATGAPLMNTAPTLDHLDGDSVAWAGVGNTVTLDMSSDASLSDAELGVLNGGDGDWAGGSLVVQRAGAAVGADTFGFDTSGAFFTVSGSELQSGGQTFA